MSNSKCLVRLSFCMFACLVQAAPASAYESWLTGGQNTARLNSEAQAQAELVRVAGMKPDIFSFSAVVDALAAQQEDGENAGECNAFDQRGSCKQQGGESAIVDSEGNLVSEVAVRGGLEEVVNEAGFKVVPTISPEEAEKLGIKPFGDGGYEGEGEDLPKIYTHGPKAVSKMSAAFTVPCANWSSVDAEERGKIASKALNILRQHGFVVLENLLSVDEVSELGRAAHSTCYAPQPGLVPQPVRADRFEAPVPFTEPWSTSDWLYKNDLVLELAARYLQNSLAAGRTKDEQRDAMVQWITLGAPLDFFSIPEWGPKKGPLLDNPPVGCSDVGSAGERGAFFGGTSMICTPPGVKSQQRHRDINMPGPTAILNVQVPLTPLTGENGPVAFVPGSHRPSTPTYEVVACPPLGSVAIYDSFAEHRGIANESPKDRFAVYYQFDSRGVNTGYTSSHFGPKHEAQRKRFRQLVDPALRQWVERVSKKSKPRLPHRS